MKLTPKAGREVLIDYDANAAVQCTFRQPANGFFAHRPYSR